MREKILKREAFKSEDSKRSKSREKSIERAIETNDYLEINLSDSELEFVDVEIKEVKEAKIVKLSKKSATESSKQSQTAAESSSDPEIVKKSAPESATSSPESSGSDTSVVTAIPATPETANKSETLELIDEIIETMTENGTEGTRRRMNSLKKTLNEMQDEFGCEVVETKENETEMEMEVDREQAPPLPTLSVETPLPPLPKDDPPEIMRDDVPKPPEPEEAADASTKESSVDELSIITVDHVNQVKAQTKTAVEAAKKEEALSQFELMKKKPTKIFSQQPKQLEESKPPTPKKSPAKLKSPEKPKVKPQKLSIEGYRRKHNAVRITETSVPDKSQDNHQVTPSDVVTAVPESLPQKKASEASPKKRKKSVKVETLETPKKSSVPESECVVSYSQELPAPKTTEKLHETMKILDRSPIKTQQPLHASTPKTPQAEASDIPSESNQYPEKDPKQSEAIKSPEKRKTPKSSKPAGKSELQTAEKSSKVAEKSQKTSLPKLESSNDSKVEKSPAKKAQKSPAKPSPVKKLQDESLPSPPTPLETSQDVVDDFQQVADNSAASPAVTNDSLDSTSKENSLNHSQKNSKKNRSYTKEVLEDGVVMITISRKKKKKSKNC